MLTGKKLFQDFANREEFKKKVNLFADPKYQVKLPSNLH
jgi:hypothetical protein